MASNKSLSELLPIAKYYVAKVNNVPFHIKSTATSGGNKLIEHNYPFNNKRFNQHLGIKPKDYNVTAYIYSESPNSLDYEQKKRDLIRELEKQESVILVHPFFGELNVDVADFNIVEDDANFGRAIIDVIFKEGSIQVYPIEGDISNENIQNSADNLNDDLSSNLADTINDTTKSTTLFARAKAKASAFGDKVDSVVTTINAAGEKLNEISSTINNFKTNINNIVATPAKLAGNITGIINSISDLLENPLDNFNLLQGFYNFGGDDISIPNNTQSRIQAKENDNLINSTIQTSALAYSYSNLSNYDFQNLDELEELRNILETQFNSIVSNSDFNEPVFSEFYDFNNKENNTNDLMDSLFDIRSNFNQYLNTIAVSLPSIETIETEGKPLAILVYERYGNLENYDKIMEINSLQNPNFINDEMEVFI